jgi:hypothetical protein
MSEYAEVRIRHFPQQHGGRENPIFPRPRDGARGYMPHFRVSLEGEYLGVVFVDGPSPIPPGGEGTSTVAFIYEVDYSCLRPGVRFEVLEGAHPIGEGVLLRRWNSSIEWHAYVPQ